MLAEPRRVLLIDDHTLVRAGLRALVDDLPGFFVVAEGSDGDELLPLVAQYTPDVVVLDISMQRMSGLDALRALRLVDATLPVVMLSMHTSRDHVVSALRAGANAYLPKEAAQDELGQALVTVISGCQYLSPPLAGVVLKELSAPPPSSAPVPTDPLTPRQREVLTLLAQGFATKEVAFRLQLSAKTVETHRAQLMERLGIRDLPGLVIYALRHGLIRIDDV